MRCCSWIQHYFRCAHFFSLIVWLWTQESNSIHWHCVRWRSRYLPHWYVRWHSIVRFLCLFTISSHNLSFVAGWIVYAMTMSKYFAWKLNIICTTVSPPLIIPSFLFFFTFLSANELHFHKNASPCTWVFPTLITLKIANKNTKTKEFV